MEPKQLSPRAQAALGFAFVALGIALAAFGLLDARIDVKPERWIAAPCGILFACAGLLVAFPRMNETPRTFLFAVLLSALGLVATWIGLGPGERHFSSSVGIGSFAISTPGNVPVGRVLFGGFGVLFDLIALRLWWQAIRRVLNPRSGT